MTPRVSVLLPCHQTDVPHLEDTIENLLETAADPWGIEILSAIDCMGYSNLDRQWNNLAARASGHWLMLWNCDAKMLTDGWDVYLDKFKDDICVVQPEDNHNALAFVIFPVRVQMLLGYITQHPFMDYWVNELMRRGGWPQHREGFIKVAHAWDTESPRAPQSLALQKDLHETRKDFWRYRIDKDVLFLKEAQAAYANHLQH